MLKNRWLPAILAGVTLMTAATFSTQSMGEEVRPPAAVPLDFLAWIDRDRAWLEQQILAISGSSSIKIGATALETTDLDALKAANRIRTFAYLAAKGLRPPYFDLPVAAADRTVRCITKYPTSIAPDIGPMDFARASFPAEAADQTELKSCTVAGKGGDYADLNRTAFRDRYFNASGTLKPEFRDLRDDSAFKAKAIDEGFFMTTEDYSGLLQLDLR